jgi:hypothetical protein
MYIYIREDLLSPVLAASYPVVAAHVQQMGTRVPTNLLVAVIV